VLIEPDEPGYYVATVPALWGCHTQAKNLDRLMKRVHEAVELCLEDDPQHSTPLELAGIQQISVSLVSRGSLARKRCALFEESVFKRFEPAAAMFSSDTPTAG
jgi:predicted RNase H-like HicB family nuclease